MNERNYKNPQPKDFLYMFEKNADRPNLQGWVSAGFKAGKVTSQTDAWYSSSDAFYMYQAENDKKVYTQEANPFLPHDITVVNSSSRPPMGIEGKEHITVSQKLYYDPTDDLSVLVYGSTFFMNTYDLIQDMTFSQARDWTAGAKLTYHVKDWFSVTGSLHADFYDRFKRHERIDTRNKDYESSIWQPRLTIREIFTGVYASDFGIWDTNCGETVRHQRAIGAENVKLLFNIVPEAAAYLAARDIKQIAKSTVFNCRPDALCVSGLTAGSATDAGILDEVKKTVPDTVVLANTGCRIDTIEKLLQIADGAVVGTTFKYDGKFENQVDRTRVKAFMDVVKKTRS